jgi:hypothetical protein
MEICFIFTPFWLRPTLPETQLRLKTGTWCNSFHSRSKARHVMYLRTATSDGSIVCADRWMIRKHWFNDDWQPETKVFMEKPVTRNALGGNHGLRSNKPATNRPSHGTAQTLCNVSHHHHHHHHHYLANLELDHLLTLAVLTRCDVSVVIYM